MRHLTRVEGPTFLVILGILVAAMMVPVEPTYAQEAVDDLQSLWIPAESQAKRGDQRYEWGEDGLSVSTCLKVSKPKAWQILSSQDRGNATILNVATGRGSATQTIELVKSEEIYRGVPVETFTVTDQPKAPHEFRGGDIKFRRAVSSDVAISFAAWDHCGTEGFIPGYLNILFDPSQKADFANWVSENVRSKRLVPTVEGSSYTLSRKHSNAAQVFMAIGEEATIFDDLKSKPWVIDYAMLPYPLDADLHVWLPSTFLPIDGHKTTASQAALHRALQAAFPQLDNTELVLNQRKETLFDVQLSAPMQRVLPNDRTYFGYWLVMNLRVSYYIERRGETVNWAGLIEAGDGFLPKRPADAEPPLPEAYLNYQLSEVGAHPYRNSELMTVIQDRLLQQHVRLFHGELKGE